jgi:hypothetical protein
MCLLDVILIRLTMGIHFVAIQLPMGPMVMIKDGVRGPQ